MNNFYFFIIVVLLVNSVFTRSIKNFNIKGRKEGYYLVNIKNSKNKKRDIDVDDNVKEAISEIHNLIVNNFDSYKNVTILEELEEINELRKRSDEGNTESPYVYAIAENEDTEETILNTYVTKDLLESIAQLPNVSHIESVHKYKPEASYNTNAILSQTKWKKLTTKAKTYNELSLISQGHYVKNLINKYDTTYYTPSTNGKNVDVYIIERSFDFSFTDFNTNDRKVSCALMVSKGKTTKVSKQTCMDYIHDYHGTIVASAIAGKNSGVAKSANIIGIALEDFSSENEIAALNYIKNNLKGNKTVVNFSYGGYSTKSEIESEYKNEQSLITSLAKQGVVFVASAGNDSFKISSSLTTNDNHIPSQLTNVISVGGIDVSNLNSLKLHEESNYGPGVDLYAPETITFVVNSSGTTTQVHGTSIAAAYVSGVSALIMGEFTSETHNSSTMLKKLRSLAIQNILSLPSNCKNYFLNNGKHIVYSLDGVYNNNGCGELAGNTSCGSSKCCASDNKCYAKSNSKCNINNGCLSSFGVCTK